MKKKLFIFSNKSVFSQEGKFYCDNIDLKSTPEGLNKKFEVNLFVRESKKKKSHEIKIKKINIFNDIFSYISSVIIASKNQDAKFLIISIDSLDKECLVNKSAGFATPATFLTSTLLVLAACCSQSVLVSTCRSLPSPCRDVIPMAALLSVHSRTGTVTPRSSNNACWPNDTAAPFTRPWNSASPEDRVILL